MDTEFKQHPVYRHIWCNDEGQVFSSFIGVGKHAIDTEQPVYLLKPYSDQRELQKYPIEQVHTTVVVSLGDDRQTEQVSRLVWECFNGRLVDGFLIRHKNGWASDNTPTNLIVGTVRDNNRDTQDHGRGIRGVQNLKAKLTEEQVNEIRASVDLSNIELSQKYGVSESTISSIFSGQTWNRGRIARSATLFGRDLVKDKKPTLILNEIGFYRHPIHKNLWATEMGGIWTSYSSSREKDVPVRTLALQVEHSDKNKSIEFQHLYVSTSIESKQANFAVHRLVWECIVGEIPKTRKVCHDDGKARHNQIENLYLGTSRDNQQDRVKMQRSNKTPKVAQETVDEIRSLYNRDLYSQRELAQKYKLSPGYIYKVVNNKLRGV